MDFSSNDSGEPLQRLASRIRRVYDFDAVPNQITSNPETTVYPNPAKEVVFIRIQKYSEDHDYTLRLIDLSGKVVLEKKLKDTPQGISLKGFVKGTYLLVILKDDIQIEQHSIVKQ